MTEKLDILHLLISYFVLSHALIICVPDGNLARDCCGSLKALCVMLVCDHVVVFFIGLSIRIWKNSRTMAQVARIHVKRRVFKRKRNLYSSHISYNLW